MSKALVVGLTGPIGSGKSAVTKLFSRNGYKIIDADVMARKVVEKGSCALIELQKAFGDDVLNVDGTLNRKVLAQKAFSTQEGTKLLNSITHPAILKLVKDDISAFESQGFTKILYDAPLLFESGSHTLCDKIVCVIADREIRMKRVKLRDNLSESEIQDRMNRQHSDSYYETKSHYVIYNNGDFEDLRMNTQEVINALNEVHDGTL